MISLGSDDESLQTVVTSDALHTEGRAAAGAVHIPCSRRCRIELPEKPARVVVISPLTQTAAIVESDK